jgi:hypothetical protein
VIQVCDALVVASLVVDEMSRILAYGPKDFFAASRIMCRQKRSQPQRPVGSVVGIADVCKLVIRVDEMLFVGPTLDIAISHTVYQI